MVEQVIAHVQDTLPSGWALGIMGVILDMDGVLYRGNTLVPEVPAFLAALEQAGVRYTMATNNSTALPEQYVAKLAGMGIAVSAEQIVTSGIATRAWLQARYPRGTRAYVVGMQALQEAIFGDGWFVEAGRDAEVVVSGAHFDLRYEHLKIACLAIRGGAAWVATNADRTLPTEEGLVPGAGAIVAALSAATDTEPVVIGKPGPAMLESCMAIMGTDARHTIVIGDRLDTDILAGHRAGIRTLLVLTGVSTAEDIARTGIVPDWVVSTLAPVTQRFLERVAAGG